MSIPAIAPSPVARLLLELEARKATGGLAVGGRRIVLTDGAIVEVRPHAEDTSLGDFLVATGRLTDEQLEHAKREASAKRQALEASLRANDLVPIDVLLDTRRALWLDRFVRGLADEEEAAREPALLSAEPHPSAGPAIGTLAFVLDALTRRAGFARDAERVGRLSQAWFEWLDTPQRARATQWADLGEVPSATLAGALFPRHPAAPSRIAALVRAGLARLSERRSNLPPPAPRNPGFAAPAREVRFDAPITATRALALQLSPGGGRSEQRPIGIVPVASWLPTPCGALNDPLDTLERRIAQLEQTGAAAHERGRAWLELAHAFRVQFDAVDEAARAAREAVAADPNSAEALELAATWCSAIGRPELAHAYAAAHAASLPDPASSAQALLRAASFAARAGKPGTALRSLRQAAELRPEDPSLAERYARALLARGEPEPAIKIALAAAERHRTRKPEAARTLLSWAHEVAPHDAAVASDFASILAAEGYAEAAIAHIARAARSALDGDVARRLWLHAAVRAEVAARPDLASDLLLEGLQRAPDEQTYLEPLYEALASSGAAMELAALGSEFAARLPDDERARCLLRSAEARLELPGEPGLALELCIEALIAEPENDRALALVEQLSGSLSADYALSDALERSLREARDQRRTRGLLERFIRLLEVDAVAPALSRWAWESWSSLTGEQLDPEQLSNLEEHARAFDQRTQALEAALWETRASERSAAALRLAQHLRRDPGQRAKARKLYEKVLEREADNLAADHALETLLRLEGQSESLSRVLTARAARLPAGPQRIAATLTLVYHLRAQGETETAKQALLGLLESAPRQREALFLLQRVALELHDESLQRETLTRSSDACSDPRGRARMLVQLSALFMRSGEPNEATRCAELALGADPRCAEAALLLVDQQALLDAPRRVAALRAARSVLGDTPKLLRLLAQSCFGINDPRGQLDALETLLRLSPLDPFPALGLAALRSTGKDAPALREAIAALIAPDRICDKTPEAARNALSRLWMLGQRREAAELALVVADALGEASTEIVAWALPAVRESEDPHLARAVLERRVARARGEERRAELRRLAHLCRSQAARAAEARVYLRLLAIEPSDTEALERLATIYAETRELERLTAVLTLRLNLARNLDERRDRLLSLALASVELLADPAAALELVRAALAPERQGDKVIDVPLSELRRGVGLLLAGPTPRQAFDLLLELSEEASEIRARELIEEAIHIAEHALKDNELALRAATLGLETHPFHSPFLLHFERLALELADVATGREVYRHLAEASVGQHGRRAILYRAARFLERAGAMSDALEMAEQAFLLAPSEGAVLGALQRYAHSTGQFEGLVHALIALAAEQVGSARRAELLSRAARLGEDQLKDVRQAVRLFTRAFEAHASEEQLNQVLRCLALLAEQDLEGARKESASLRDALTRQAREARTSGERAAALLTLAELSLDLLQNQDEAQTYAQAAKHLMESGEQPPAAELTLLSARLDQVLARAPQRKDTRPQGLRTVSERPAEKLAIPKWSDPRRSLARPSSRETLRPFALATPSADDPRATLPGVAAPAIEPAPTRRSLRVEPSLDALNSEEESLLQALATGQSDALARLQESVSPAIEHNAKLCDALLARTRKQPLSLASIRGLWLLSERAHRRDLRAVTSELLSHVDPTITCTRTGRLADPQDEATKVALAEARDDGSMTPVFGVLGQLFLSGGPLFRRPLANYGVSASDFIAARDDNAFAEALRDVSSVLGIEHEAYLTPSGRDAINVAPTYPPSLIIGDGTAQAPIALRFRLGAAFEQARPSSVLLASLARDAMTTLLAALQAAFGAANAAAPIQRDAAAMASELWRTLPGATQKQITGVLRTLSPEAMPYQGLVDQLRLRAARVGLVTSGALDVALEHLALEGDADGARVPTSEAALGSALSNQPLLASLLSFALSDAYLALRSRESS